MTIQVEIVFDDDDRDTALKLVGEMLYRFGNAQLYESDEPDEPSDDETVIDINTLLSRDNHLSRQVDELVDQGVPRDEVLGHLDELLTKQLAPVGNALAVIEKDPTPPHGVRRIVTGDNSPHGKAIKRRVVAEVGCPECYAGPGQYCKSPGGSVYSSSHVHRQRIDAWYDAQEAQR